jgi:hypothetical protein
MISKKVWVNGLLQEIQLMANGNGITNLPLPIDNPRKRFVGKPSTIFVTDYPICTLSYACNNVAIAS